MSTKRSPWVWMALIAIGAGVYLLFGRAEPPAPKNADEVGEVKMVPAPPPDVSRSAAPKIQNPSALEPATGIADDAAEAIRRMNQDAEKMMEEPEVVPGQAQ